MKYKINKGFVFQKIDQDTVIFDSEKMIFFTINESASYIFNCLKKGMENKEIVKKMVKRYGIESKKAEKDLADCIKDMKKKKIILDYQKN